ncbi:hypothetical protein EDC94DRAFT_663094 [Helicostylum pulchrum]|nr:hypothetical protein EDC94DRAFT_663094 [Helicostylum pulchrum]
MTAALRASLLQRVQELSAEDVSVQSYTAVAAAAGPPSSGGVPPFSGGVVPPISGGPAAPPGPSSGGPAPSRYDLRSDRVRVQGERMLTLLREIEAEEEERGREVMVDALMHAIHRFPIHRNLNDGCLYVYGRDGRTLISTDDAMVDLMISDDDESEDDEGEDEGEEQEEEDLTGVVLQIHAVPPQVLQHCLDRLQQIELALAETNGFILREQIDMQLRRLYDLFLTIREDRPRAIDQRNAQRYAVKMIRLYNLFVIEASLVQTAVGWEDLSWDVRERNTIRATMAAARAVYQLVSTRGPVMLVHPEWFDLRLLMNNRRTRVIREQHMCQEDILMLSRAVRAFGELEAMHSVIDVNGQQLVPDLLD